MIVIISGPSCVGKTTIVETLLRRNNRWDKVKNYTSRNKRPEEINGMHYHFIDREAFEEGIRNRSFAEHDYIYGNYYGIHKEEIMGHEGGVLLMILFTDSVHMISNNYDDCLTFFINPPSFDVLQDRMIRRSIDEPEKQRRLDSALYEMKNADRADYVLVNDSLIECCMQIESIINKEVKKRGFKTIQEIEMPSEGCEDDRGGKAFSGNEGRN